MRNIITTLRVFLIFALICGILYPLFIFAFAQTLLREQANGTLLEKNDHIIGSLLIGQEFTAPRYFHGRPSVINYDAANSSASNLAPSNSRLIAMVKDRLKQLRNENNLSSNATLPADMVFASASGLDPHISLANALLQLPRVAKSRNLPEAKVKKIIYENLESDFIGVWGQAGVNVLKLNLTLDET